MKDKHKAGWGRGDKQMGHIGYLFYKGFEIGCGNHPFNINMLFDNEILYSYHGVMRHEESSIYFLLNIGLVFVVLFTVIYHFHHSI